MGHQKPQIEELSIAKRTICDEMPFTQASIQDGQLVVNVKARNRDKFDQLVADELGLEIVDETPFKSHQWFDKVSLE